MLDPESMRNTVEWKQTRPEDGAIWVSVTRRSADQVAFESEDAQLVRYKEKVLNSNPSVTCSGGMILLLGAYVSLPRAIPPNWMDWYSFPRQVEA